MTDAPTHDSDVSPAPTDIPFARPIQADVFMPPPPPRCELMLFDLEPRTAWADVGWLVLGLLTVELLIGTVVQFVATAVYALPTDGIQAADPATRRVLLFLNLGLRAVGWVGVVLWVHRRRKLTLSYIGLRRDGRVADVGLGLVSVVGIYAFIIAGVFTIRVLWPELYKGFEQNADEIKKVLPKLSLFQFALVSMAVGVYEEVLFRGFLMPRLRRATGSWIFAVLLSSAVFTALHMFDQTPAAMLLIGFLSLAFSVITILRRSILPAIVAHTLFDFSQFVGLYVSAGDSWK